jgi:hypothetical protein
VFSRSGLPREVVCYVITLLLEVVAASVSGISDCLVRGGYQRIKKFDVIVRGLTKLLSGERREIRMCSLTSLERRALYSYRDCCGGISIQVITNRKEGWYACRWCQHDEQRDSLWKCPRCNGRGVTRGYFREDVRVKVV